MVEGAVVVEEGAKLTDEKLLVVDKFFYIVFRPIRLTVHIKAESYP